jgi:hypothetical protein
LNSSFTDHDAALVAPVRESNIRANARLLFRCWWIVFTFVAAIQVVLWPDADNILCVSLAWVSCILTGVAMFRQSALLLYPWSSLMALVFCLSTSGLPLVLTLLQGDPITFNLEVPVATFGHLLLCQIVVLLVHIGYRDMRIWRKWEDRFRATVLRPLGVIEAPSGKEMLGIGALGLAASIYVLVFVRDQNDGTLQITGSIFDKFAQGLIPLAYTPFLLLLPLTGGGSRKGFIWKFGFVILYSLPILFLALAANTRTLAFLGVATIGLGLLLMVLSGDIRLDLKKNFVLALIILPLALLVADNIAIAMRAAREERAEISSLDEAKETFKLLTIKRDELKTPRNEIAGGNDDSEAWYVTNPLFSRLVCAQFQDRALAVGLDMNDEEKQALRRVENDHILEALPNPLLKILADARIGLIDEGFDKNEVNVGGCSIGAYMLYLGGASRGHGPQTVVMDESGDLFGDVFATGGFIGDGFAAYGWSYLLIFAASAFVLFLFCDALYSPASQIASDELSRETSFALVGLINGFTLATILSADGIADFVWFIVRQPFQMLLTYCVVFWLVRFASQTLFGKPRTWLTARSSLCNAATPIYRKE